MKRRTLLAVLGTTGVAGLAGCLGRSQPSSTKPTATVTANSTSTTDATTTAEGEIQRRISLASQDSVPNKYNIEINATVLEPLITTTHPARVRITMTNKGSRRALSVWGETCDLFNRSRGGSDAPRGLWLHDPEQAASIERKEGKWVADRQTDFPRGYAAYGCGKKMVGAGEAFSSEYVVWDDYQVSGYLTPGTYRWEEPVSISEDADTQTSDDQRQSFTWGFSLQVEDPDS